MHKNLLAIGITVLFLGVVVTPMTLGYDVETNRLEVIEPLDITSDDPPMDSQCPIYCNDIHHTNKNLYNTAENTGFEEVDEQGYSLMKSYDYNWESQKMGIPSGTSTICGYVTDEVTGLPVENAKAEIIKTSYYDYTNSTGFYKIITEPLYSAGLWVYGDKHLDDFQWCYYLYENKTKWVNFSLRPRPSETSIFYGYITDEITGEPLEDAKVEVDWRDADYHEYWNSTYTNSLGFYSINVGAPGSMRVLAYADGYFTGCWNQCYWYEISENKTKWANISVYPHPSENSIFFGFITDTETGKPIDGAEVELAWSDGWSRHLSNFTVTNSLGYYCMNAGAGKVRIYVYAKGYWDNNSSLYEIGENETVQVNVALEPLPPENCVVRGYITDVNTSEPIELAKITLYWEECRGGKNWNSTYTGTSGFYKMNSPAGRIYLKIEAHGYYSEYTIKYKLDENETILLNISMYKRLPRSSVVCGYITDEDSGEPIFDVNVDLVWRDSYGHGGYGWGNTNTSGYYSINISAGEIQLYTYHYHYKSKDIGWQSIGKNETLWVNITLKFENRPPSHPEIKGPTRCKLGQEYNYTFRVNDSHGDDVYYYIEWGDGTYTDWIGPYRFYEKTVVNHTFSKMGTYYIRARAKDIYGAEDDYNWGYLKVTIPKTKSFIFNFDLFSWFLERFPLLERLLGLIRYT